MTSTTRKNFRGAKWLREASYITESTRERVAQAMTACAESYPEFASTIGVRPASYIGPDCDAMVCVTFGPGGGRIFRSV